MSTVFIVSFCLWNLLIFIFLHIKFENKFITIQKIEKYLEYLGRTT